MPSTMDCDEYIPGTESAVPEYSESGVITFQKKWKKREREREN